MLKWASLNTDCPADTCDRPVFCPIVSKVRLQRLLSQGRYYLVCEIGTNDGSSSQQLVRGGSSEPGLTRRRPCGTAPPPSTPALLGRCIFRGAPAAPSTWARSPSIPSRAGGLMPRGVRSRDARGLGSGGSECVRAGLCGAARGRRLLRGGGGAAAQERDTLLLPVRAAVGAPAAARRRAAGSAAVQGRRM